MTVEEKLKKMGLALPESLKLPPGVELPFSFVRVRGKQAFISGHLPQQLDGSVAELRGKVGKEISVEQGYEAARLTALSALGSIKRELGDLDKVVWLKVFGMVNAAPGFIQLPQVINGFSELIIELYGPERGGHARSAVGLAELPYDQPVEIEAQIEIA